MPNIETEQEVDGRWIAEIVDVPSVICYGSTCEDAVRNVQKLYERVVADRLENGIENSPRKPVYPPM